MAKKKRQVVTDDMEYEFKETGEPQAETPMEPEYEEIKPKTAFFQHRLVKRIGIIVVLVIAVVIVYEFIMPGDTQTVAKKSEPDGSIAISQPVQPAPQTTAVNSETQEKVDLLSQENAAVDSEMKQVQADIQNLNQKIEQIAMGMNDLNNKLQSFSEQVQSLQEEKATNPAVKRQVAKKAIVAPQPAYYLKAVVPGRAWLQSKAGHLMTVKVGDRIAGYGTIQAINAESGWVGTSSGRVISYGPNDS